MSKKWQSRLGVIACGALVVWTGIAVADMSLRQRNVAKEEDEYFKKELDSANERCGTQVDARIDWPTFAAEIDKSLDGGPRYSFSGFCNYPLNNLYHLCADADAKAAIQKRIKSYSCKFGGAGKRKIELTGSTLTLWVDWEAANYDDYIKAYLEKTL